MPKELKYTRATKLVVGYFALLIGTSLIAKGAPAFAWDVMDQWGRQAALFLQALAEGRSYSFDYVHPATNYLILAFDSVWTSHISPAAAGTTWLIGIIALWQLLYLTAKKITDNSTASALLSTAAAFSPLAEQHALMWGYAELWMSLSIAAVTYLIATASTLTLTNTSLICAFTLALSLLKGSGPLLSALIVGSILLSGILARLPPVGRLAMIFSLIFFLILLRYCDMTFELFGWEFWWNPTANVVRVGDRSELMSANPYHLIVGALKHAYFVNQSYTVIFSAYIIAVAICVVESITAKRSFLVTFNVIMGIGLLLYYVVAMRVSDYFFVHAVPSSDVGLSRFSLYMLAPASTVIAHSISLAETYYRRNSEC